MSHNNRQNNFTKPVEKEPVTEPTIEPIVDEVVQDQPEQVNEVEKETEVVTLHGCVNVERLNVRTNPDVNSDVITVILKGTTLEISNEDNPTFYEITLLDGTKGYAMKEFIDREV